MDKVSLVAREDISDDEIAGVDLSNGTDNKLKEDATKGAIAGGILGGLTGLLVGLGTLAIPGIGSVALAGSSTSIIATTLSSSIGAATGGIVGVLMSIGIPAERAKMYGDRVSQGEYLVLVEGTESDLRQAASLLLEFGLQEWEIYQSPTWD